MLIICNTASSWFPAGYPWRSHKTSLYSRLVYLSRIRNIYIKMKLSYTTKSIRKYSILLTLTGRWTISMVPRFARQFTTLTASCLINQTASLMCRHPYLTGLTICIDLRHDDLFCFGRHGDVRLSLAKFTDSDWHNIESSLNRLIESTIESAAGNFLGVVAFCRCTPLQPFPWNRFLLQVSLQ